MRRLGQFMMRGYMQAVVVISALSLLSVFVSPLAYVISGTPMGLVCLRRGPIVGLQVLMGCLLLVALFAMAARIQPQVALIFFVAIWLPVSICCYVLRQSESQGIMVIAAGAIGLLIITISYVYLGDVQEWWRQFLYAWLDQTVTQAQADQIRPVFDKVIPYMNGVMAAGVTGGIVITVLLARWWQSWIYHPGGFQQEFLQLRLPRVTLVVLPVAVVLMLMQGTGLDLIARDVLIVWASLYMFHGISAVHGIVAIRNLSQAWIVGMYLALVFFSLHTALFLACLGIIDSLVGKRPGHLPPSE